MQSPEISNGEGKGSTWRGRGGAAKTRWKGTFDCALNSVYFLCFKVGSSFSFVLLHLFSGTFNKFLLDVEDVRQVSPSPIAFSAQSFNDGAPTPKSSLATLSKVSSPAALVNRSWRRLVKALLDVRYTVLLVM